MAAGGGGEEGRSGRESGKAVCHMLTYRLQESKTYENAAAIAAAGGAAGAGAGTGAGAGGAGAAGGTGAASTAAAAQPQRPAHAKEYNFLDMELKYGFLQVSLEYTNPCVFLYISLSLHSLAAAHRSFVVSALFRSRNSSKCVSILDTNNQAWYLEARRHGVCG